MGNRKKASRGRRTQFRHDVQGIVHGLTKGIELGIVHLPKSVYLYRAAIYDAMDGNFLRIKQAIKSLEHHHLATGKITADNIHLQRWKAGMLKSYEGCYYVLKMYLQLFTEYWSQKHGATKPVSKGSNKQAGWHPHSMVGVSQQIHRNHIELD